MATQYHRFGNWFKTHTEQWDGLSRRELQQLCRERVQDAARHGQALLDYLLRPRQPRYQAAEHVSAAAGRASGARKAGRGGGRGAGRGHHLRRGAN